jgi:hypothetical protein
VTAPPQRSAGPHLKRAYARILVHGHQTLAGLADLTDRQIFDLYPAANPDDEDAPQPVPGTDPEPDREPTLEEQRQAYFAQGRLFRVPEADLVRVWEARHGTPESKPAAAP